MGLDDLINGIGEKYWNASIEIRIAVGEMMDPYNNRYRESRRYYRKRRKKKSKKRSYETGI